MAQPVNLWALGPGLTIAPVFQAPADFYQIQDGGLNLQSKLEPLFVLVIGGFMVLVLLYNLTPQKHQPGMIQILSMCTQNRAKSLSKFGLFDSQAHVLKK